MMTVYGPLFSVSRDFMEGVVAYKKENKEEMEKLLYGPRADSKKGKAKETQAPKPISKVFCDCSVVLSGAKKGVPQL